MDGVVWRQADVEVTLKTVRNRIVKNERWVDEPRGDRLVVPDADPAFKLIHVFLSFQPGIVVHGISVKLTSVVKLPPGHAPSKPSRTAGLLAKNHRDERTPRAGPQTDDCDKTRSLHPAMKIPNKQTST